MLNFLYNTAEFAHIDIRVRKEAAWQAQQACMKEKGFRLAVLIILVAVTVGSFAQILLFGRNTDGAVGATIGFFIGLFWFGKNLNKLGMPHYRRILSQGEIAQRNKPFDPRDDDSPTL